MAVQQSPPGKRQSAEGSFWEWFALNEARLFAFENEQEVLASEIAGKLHACHPDLTFEIGTPEEGRREFVISAGGMRDAFPAVHLLADEAPPLARWTITRLRQPKSFIGSISVPGLTLAVDSVRYVLSPARGKANITLFMPGYRAKERAKYVTMGFLLLDALLGEFDVEMKLGRIDVLPAESSAAVPKKPLSELRTELQSLIGP